MDKKIKEDWPKACDKEGARELMARVKRRILSKEEEALSVYANLRKSGKHIIWAPKIDADE